MEKSEVPPPMSAISAICSPDICALVIERGRDRLELEGDLVEAEPARDLAQRVLGLGVGIRRVVDEMHRTAMHDAAEFDTGRLLRAPLHRTDISGDDVAEGLALAPELRGLVDQRGAEQRLQAAHQPTIGAIHIGLDRAPADRNAAVAAQRRSRSES